MRSYSCLATTLHHTLLLATDGESEMLQTKAIMTDQSQKGEKRKEDLLFKSAGNYRKNSNIYIFINEAWGARIAASLNACYFLFLLKAQLQMQ